jgi:hypothetical protein
MIAATSPVSYNHCSGMAVYWVPFLTNEAVNLASIPPMLPLMNSVLGERAAPYEVSR